MLSRLKASSGRGPPGGKLSKQSSRASSHSSGLICAGGEGGAFRMRYSRRKASSEIPRAASSRLVAFDDMRWEVVDVYLHWESSISSYQLGGCWLSSSLLDQGLINATV